MWALVAAMHGLNCSGALGISQDPGWNPRLLYCKASFLNAGPAGKPPLCFLTSVPSQARGSLPSGLSTHTLSVVEEDNGNSEPAGAPDL